MAAKTKEKAQEKEQPQTADLAVKDPDVVKIQDQLPTLLEKAKNFQVVSDADLETGAKVMSWFSTQLDKLEARRLFFVKPIDQHVRNMNTFFRGIRVPLEDAKKIVADKMLDYRRKKQEAADKEAERVRKLSEKKAEKLGVAVEDLPPAVVPQPKVEAPAKSVGDTTFSKVWTFELVDLAKVPTQYVELNEQAVRAAIRSGVREIPGVKIFEKEQMSVR